MRSTIRREDTNLFCRLITLNGMKVSEELTEEQVRQVRRDPPVYPCHIDSYLVQLMFDVEHAYAEFLRSLGGEKNPVS